MKLGKKRRFLADDREGTKKKILREATKLFALKGYDAVSVREIAGAVGIKPASLYGHYTGKETLLGDVLEHAGQMYRVYFELLDEAMKDADTLEEVIDLMFVELEHVTGMDTYYGVSLMQMEQFRDDTARKMYMELLQEFSISKIQSYLDRLVAQGRLAPFDTHAAATMLMCVVLTGNQLRIHESCGCPIPFSIDGMYGSIKQYMMDSILTLAGKRFAVERKQLS